MGANLNLLPASNLDIGAAPFSHQIIRVEMCDEFAEVVLAVEEQWGRDVPEGFRTYLAHGEEGESHYGPTPEHEYGPMKYVKAGRLAAIDHPWIQEGHLNRAVWAYLRELPPDWPVALYWC